MKTFSGRATRLAGASAIAVAASLAFAGMATAQSATGTLRGQITEGGAPEAGGVITATEVATGYVSRSNVDAQGRYVLPGLRPGTYTVSVTSGDGQTASQTVTVGLGQTGTLNLDVASAVTADTGATTVDEIIVRAERVIEVRTSEVATNVTRQQINDLPQINRNFLNFAALAPSLVVREDPAERTIYAGAQSANAVNVFIDGANQKSNILDGGIAGQDDNRGNPFPQAAVAEFRVLSQNFKAEYEQAGSAIITSVTRSGTNEFTGEVFAFYSDTDWYSQDVFSSRRGAAKPQLDRLQWGAALGGPIIEDRLHFFASYERKDETRANNVFLNRTEFTSLFEDELGTFEAPFEQDLFFGKLSWQIDDRQRIDLSATYNSARDIRDFGGQNASTRANEVNQDVNNIVLRHTYQGDNFLNELSIDWLYNEYNPQAVNFDLSGQNYVIYRDATAGGAFNFNYNQVEATVFNLGGGTNNQEIRDEAITLRNDLTLYGLEWYGNHTIKMGVRYSSRDYFVQKFFNRNPQFRYDINARPEILGSAAIPTQVSLNLPTDPADVSNNTFGIYIQDDWQITDKLELNLGVRWDYEDNAVNNDWVTPDSVRGVLAAFETVAAYNPPVNVDDYISDGDRDAFMGAIQPRIGFSYDWFGDESTVLFGGAGRYYDRIGFNFAFSERFSPFNLSRTIYFSPAGGAFGGQTNTVAWDPRYLDRANLDTLLAGTQGRGEIFLVKNDAPVPYTDQFNFGVRQRFGDIQTALTFAYSHTRDEFGWYRLNVNSANQIVARPSQFTNPATGQPYAFNDSVFYSDHNRERKYKAIYLTVDRPFRDGYGFNVAYTYAEGEQNGSRDQGLGAFDFDYATLAQSPWFNTPGVERHRLVASGTLALPADFRLSGILTLGSGRPYTVFNCPTPSAPGPNICWFDQFPRTDNFIIPDAFAYRQVDLRLTKTFETFEGHNLDLIIDAINVFDFKNYSGFDQSFTSANFGRPTAVFSPQRTLQVGLRYSW